MGGSPPSDSAEKKATNQFMADISREQWADYEKRFTPYEKTLKNELGGGAALKDVGFVQRQIPAAFDQQRQAMGQDFARMGIAPTADQQTDLQGTLARQETSALIGASNAARQHAQDRDMAVLSGGMATMNRNVRGTGPVQG